MFSYFSCCSLSASFTDDAQRVPQMSDATLETNELKPAVREVSQILPTTTPDGELSSLPQSATKLESSPVLVPNVDKSDPKPVITENERAGQTLATPIVALEQPIATGTEFGRSKAPISTPELAATTQETTSEPASNLLPPPETTVELTMSASPQSTVIDPRPAETTTIPAITEAQSPRSQPAGDADPATDKPSEAQGAEGVLELQNKLTQKFTEAEWTALREFRVSVLVSNTLKLMI